MNATNGTIPLVISTISAVLAFALFAIPLIVGARKLARSYPDRRFVPKRTYTSVSGQFGCVSVGGLWVGLNDEGIRIRTPWRFQALCPALVVPWSAVVGCRRERRYFVTTVRLDIAAWDQPIFLRGFLWRDEDAISTFEGLWAEHRPDVRQPSSPEHRQNGLS
jgi:hypothetical protein